LSADGILTDQEIMLKIAGYDSKALELLYNRYSPMLYALVKRIIPNQELAEEVLSEVFVIILKQIDEFDYKSSDVYAWLVTLTRNKAIDAMKRAQGKEKRMYTEEYEKEEIIPKLSPSIKALDFSEVIDMKDKVQAAFNGLSDFQRQVLELAYYEGLDENVIADRLKIPVSSVKSKLHLASANLRKQILIDKS